MPAAIPAEARPFCLGHATGFGLLESEGTGVDWLYVSPAGDFDHTGPRTGRYRVADRGDDDDRGTVTHP